MKNTTLLAILSFSFVPAGASPLSQDVSAPTSSLAKLTIVGRNPRDTIAPDTLAKREGHVVPESANIGRPERLFKRGPGGKGEPSKQPEQKSEDPLDWKFNPDLAPVRPDEIVEPFRWRPHVHGVLEKQGYKPQQGTAHLFQQANGYHYTRITNMVPEYKDATEIRIAVDGRIYRTIPEKSPAPNVGLVGKMKDVARNKPWKKKPQIVLDKNVDYVYDPKVWPKEGEPHRPEPHA